MPWRLGTRLSSVEAVGGLQLHLRLLLGMSKLLGVGLLGSSSVRHGHLLAHTCDTSESMHQHMRTSAR